MEKVYKVTLPTVYVIAVSEEHAVDLACDKVTEKEDGFKTEIIVALD
ncbi:MAG: hypothetical protein HOG49_18365 [Candidatus Scalindua sp.]|nr:hypothetical protein [Candidatus Scalindua sp.]